MAVNVKIGLIGALDMLKFKNMAKVREQAIKAAPVKEITADYAINNSAKALHPDFQELIIDKVIDHGSAGAKTFLMRSKDGGLLAYFRAKTSAAKCWESQRKLLKRKDSRQTQRAKSSI